MMTPDTYSDGAPAEPQAAPSRAEVMLANARWLIHHAQEQGLVLTIDLVPKQPLAMGHYEMVANVRPINVREAS